MRKKNQKLSANLHRSGKGKVLELSYPSSVQGYDGVDDALGDGEEGRLESDGELQEVQEGNDGDLANSIMLANSELKEVEGGPEGDKENKESRSWVDMEARNRSRAQIVS